MRHTGHARPCALLGAALLLAACSRQPPSPPTTPEPAAATAGTPTITATVPPTGAATLGPSAPAAAAELRVSSSPLASGTYTRSDFSPRITFAVDGPWYAVQLAPGFFDVQQDVGSPDVIAVQFANVEAIYGADGERVELAGADEAPGVLEANPAITVLGSSGSRIGGLEGVAVEIENSGDGDVRVLHVPAGPLAFSPGRRLWIALFDTTDGVLGILVGGSVATWEEALLAAEPVLESVRIGD
jgi:hypothetical protein